MSERKRLQPWFQGAAHAPPGRVAWKIEDRYRPGLPDFVVKVGERVWMVELKWSRLARDVRVELSAGQWRHLREWGSGACVLVAAAGPGRCHLIPASALPEPVTTWRVEVLEALPGVTTAPLTRAGVASIVDAAFGVLGPSGRL